jgi:RNA polymerase sigma-70 factor (ECF subfamily)
MPPFPELLSAAQAGDQDAFATIYRANHPAVLRYLRVTARGAAEDIAAEAWYEVARGIRRFEGDEAGFRGWLFTIAHRRRLDWQRAVRRRPSDSVPTSDFVDLPGTDDPAIVVGDALSTEEALRLIATLPPDQAEVVALRAIAGFDVAQVAALLGKRPGAVRVAGHRGLKKLAERLGGDIEAEV